MRAQVRAQVYAYGTRTTLMCTYNVHVHILHTKRPWIHAAVLYYAPGFTPWHAYTLRPWISITRTHYAPKAPGFSSGESASVEQSLQPHLRMTGIMAILLVPSAQNTRTRRDLIFFGTQQLLFTLLLLLLFVAPQPPTHCRCVTRNKQ